MNQGNSFITLIIAIIYVLCPIDIIPDFIPIIGWIDDIIVFLTALNSMKSN